MKVGEMHIRASAFLVQAPLYSTRSARAHRNARLSLLEGLSRRSVCLSTKSFLGSTRLRPSRIFETSPSRRWCSTGVEASFSIDKLKFPPLPEVKFPPYVKETLSNGMTVFVIEDPELPLVNGVCYVRSGGRWDPEEKLGLSELAGIVLRSGGSRKVPAEKLDRILEQRAASIESGSDRSVFSIGFAALSDDFEKVLGLWADLIRHPAFPEEKLTLAQLQFEASIARRNDDPGGIVSREFGRLLYGEDSPYARVAQYDTIRRVTTRDLHELHDRYFHPNNCVVGIHGDVKADEVIKQLEKSFGNWKNNPLMMLPKVPQTEQANKGKIFLIDKPELTQSYVEFGQIGGEVLDPDYAALTMMNGVLNGFGGRLFNNVRSRQGLAYSVYGQWNPGFDHAGAFQAGGETGGDVAAFITGINNVINELREEPPTSTEVEYARESVLNGFIFNFASIDTVMSRLIRYQYYGYPFDNIFLYRRKVEDCTAEEILRVTNQNLRPEDFVYVVAGPAEQIRPSLEKLGLPIELHDITIQSATVPRREVVLDPLVGDPLVGP